MLSAITIALSNDKSLEERATHGLYIDNEKVIATDHIKLIMIPNTNEESKEYEIKSIDSMTPCVINANAIKKVVKNLSKDQKCYVSRQDNESVTISIGDKEKIDIECPVIPKKYPDVEAIFPKVKPISSIFINKKKLVDILNQFNGDMVAISYFGEEKPIAIEGFDEKDKGIFGLVMPLLEKEYVYRYQ
jgi:hypothetical protein